MWGKWAAGIALAGLLFSSGCSNDDSKDRQIEALEQAWQSTPQALRYDACEEWHNDRERAIKALQATEEITGEAFELSVLEEFYGGKCQ